MTKKKYSIVRLKKYRRDYKRIARSGQYDLKKLENIITKLANGERLPEKCKNHFLKGEMTKYQECHIKDDWVLVYQYSHKELILVLIRTGTHSKVFN